MVKRLPDEREAIEGAGVATATAATLLGDADLLAGAGSYGIARSLAVLALEESVKARTLGAIALAASYGGRPGFSDDDLRKIVYSGHRERHDAGFLQHVAAASLRDPRLARRARTGVGGARICLIPHIEEALRRHAATLPRRDSFWRPKCR
jgi:AbiV family abortive infection protein